MQSKQSKRIEPVQAIPASVCRGLEMVFVDIDDTLTQGGVLPAASYQSLWRLHDSGIAVVPITGRPAGWCDHIARFWPVEAVVGENGALYYAYQRSRKRMVRRYTVADRAASENEERLRRIRDRVLAEVPGAAVAADQPFRLFDLAIDYAEDVQPLDRDSVRAICRIMAEEGATYKVSSIHVNCWYGKYNKVSGMSLFLTDRFGCSLEELNPKLMFVGDSPNDEPLFKAIENAVAVASLRKFLDDLRYLPKYLASGEAAEGFCETVDVILSKRGA